MNQAAILRHGSLLVIDKTSLYAFERRDGKYRFKDSGAQTCANSPRACDMAGVIGEEMFEGVKGQEPDCGFESISGH